MTFTHFNEQGRAKMVDISSKKETERVAIARGEVVVSTRVLQKIEKGEVKKGDVFSVAQVAGIMAAKNTSQLIPMCHPLSLTGVNIHFTTEETEKDGRIYIEAKVKTTSKTGVEMEALTAVSVTALTIYDMCKAIDPHMVIGPTEVIKKIGGKRDFTQKRG